MVARQRTPSASRSYKKRLWVGDCMATDPLQAREALCLISFPFYSKACFILGVFMHPLSQKRQAWSPAVPSHTRRGASALWCTWKELQWGLPSQESHLQATGANYPLRTPRAGQQMAMQSFPILPSITHLDGHYGPLKHFEQQSENVCFTELPLRLYLVRTSVYF